MKKARGWCTDCSYVFQMNAPDGDIDEKAKERARAHAEEDGHTVDVQVMDGANRRDHRVSKNGVVTSPTWDINESETAPKAPRKSKSKSDG